MLDVFQDIDIPDGVLAGHRRQIRDFAMDNCRRQVAWDPGAKLLVWLQAGPGSYWESGEGACVSADASSDFQHVARDNGGQK